MRLILLLKAASLARGFSGVREEVIDALLALHNQGLTPVIPCQGSVGASGDLAPLAHLSLPLVGEGEVFYQGERMPAAHALERAGIRPIQLSAKEGLALINGTQVSTALAIDALLATDRLFEAAVISGALTLDAARGSDGPFDPRIHAVRGQPGQIACAAAYRALMVGSEIRRSHLENDDRVQDPYSLRCQPQVMGACLDQMRYAAQVLVREANAVTDNPLVFAADGPPGLRRQFPRRAGGAGRRRAGGRHRGNRRDHRAPHRHAGGHRGVAPAALPHARPGPELRLHDRARHRGGARIGKQVARPPGQRRQPAHLGQPGRPCEHGHLRGAAPAADAAGTRRTSWRSSCSPPPRASNSSGL